MKVAVYSGTRNVYKDMLTPMKSLLINSDVEKVYFLIEDGSFPYNLPPQVECMNISKQMFFHPNTCPNWNPWWGGVMTLIRVAYSKLFPNLDMILSLDNDTIVDQDISHLWDLDLTNYYLAGAPDTPVLNANGLYVNCGVILFNLKKIREDGVDNKAIYILNHIKKSYSEQDVLNQLCRGKILELPNSYNCRSAFKGYDPNDRKIIHWAGWHEYKNDPLYKKYENIPLEDIRK